MSRTYNSLEVPAGVNGYKAYLVTGITENLSIPRLIYLIHPTQAAINDLYRFAGIGRYTGKSTNDDSKLQVVSYSGRDNILKFYQLLGNEQIAKQLIEEFQILNSKQPEAHIIPQNINQVDPNPQEVQIEDGLPMAPMAIQPNYVLSPTYVTINLNNGSNNLLDNSANYGRIFNISDDYDPHILVAIDRFTLNTNIPKMLMPLQPMQMPNINGQYTLSIYKVGIIFNDGINELTYTETVPYFNKNTPRTFTGPFGTDALTTDYCFVNNISDFISYINDALAKLYLQVSANPNYNASTGGFSNTQIFIEYDQNTGICTVRFPGYQNYKRGYGIPQPILKLFFNDDLAKILKFPFYRSVETSVQGNYVLDTSYCSFVDYDMATTSYIPNNGYGHYQDNFNPKNPQTAILLLSQNAASLNYSVFPLMSILFTTNLGIQLSYPAPQYNANAENNQRAVLDDFNLDVSGGPGLYRETISYNSPGLTNARYHKYTSKTLENIQISCLWMDCYGVVRGLTSSNQYANNSVKLVFVDRQFLIPKH